MHTPNSTSIYPSVSNGMEKNHSYLCYPIYLVVMVLLYFTDEGQVYKILNREKHVRSPARFYDNDAKSDL